MSEKFGRLTVTGEAPALLLASGRKRLRYVCKCDCGKERIVSRDALRGGYTQSCGCLKNEVMRRLKTTHGHARQNAHSKTYRAWANMFIRCQNEKLKKYYGHVSVCEHWKKFENFLEDMGENPVGKSVDRIRNEGNYEPGNCRWATAKEQANNRRPWGSV